MNLRVQEPGTPKPQTPSKRFGDTALGTLITTLSCTDTNDVHNLLEAKKRQIKEIQNEFTRARTAEIQSLDFERRTKDKFYLMPNIRKTPVKTFYKNNSPVPKARVNSDKPLPDDIEVFWHKMSTQGWRPETRQEATLTNIDNKLYLIGGVSRSINHDINKLNPLSRHWEKLSPVGVEPDPRFGHTALEYKGKIIVFGGGTNFNTVHKLRECLNGIKIFTPDPVRWDYMKTSGTYISTRKYHSAAIIGKHLFIYGGLNQKNNLLNDCALLNIEKSVWKSIYLEGPVENAFHTSVSVLNQDQKSFRSIYEVPFSCLNKVQKPGIYIFGGIGSDKQAHDTMWLVSVGKRPLVWSIVVTEGKGPSPRFLHSMIYNEKSNHICIFGGRIDMSQTSTYTCFNDVYLLCMQRLLWVKVRVLGEVPQARSGHCTVVSGSRMFIFGGVSNTCYCSSDMFVLETDPAKVVDLARREEKKKQFLIDVENYKAKKTLRVHSVLSKKSSRTLSRLSENPSPEGFYY